MGTHAQIRWASISPSPTLLKFAGKIAASGKAPTLDVACGFGRNAIALVAHGCHVVCVDRDLLRLRQLHKSRERLLGAGSIAGQPGSIMPVCANLREEFWPFSGELFNAIISIHFVKIELFPLFFFSLATHGYLYIETFGNHGQNYLDLPKPGQIRTALNRLFAVIYYDEKRVGPRGDAVTVKAFGRTMV